MATVTFLEAAAEVLRKSRHPMTAWEITEAALKAGLIQTRGKTPHETMASALYTAPDDFPVKKDAIPGRIRSRRGSVRWKYVD